VNTRRFFVPATLLALSFTVTAVAGQYQRTRDDKTLVWNEDHKRGELVSWSGKRDADGYATGYGTLTWYAPEDRLETGSNLPREQPRVLSRVTGTMVHGKFEEAPPKATTQGTIEPAQPKKRGWLSSIFKPRAKPTPAPVEPTPKPRRRSSSHIEATPPEESPAPTNAEASPTPSSGAANDSLDSLMHAPSSLKLNSPTPSPSAAISSPAATPDASPQPAQPTSPSPTP
jgi:hypothetical protein